MSGFDTQARPDGFPRYPVPIPEAQPTVDAGDSTYGTRKVALERELLAAAGELPVTLLRAGAIHGPHCRTPRELYFVKRALDRRPVRVLAYGGGSRFHPVHVSNVAELIRLAALRPGPRVLNAADPGAPTVAEIGAAIDEVTGFRPSGTFLIGGPPPSPSVGETPWSGAHPVVYDMGAAERELGYRPVTEYAQSLPATVEWLAAQLHGRHWTEAFPKMAANYGRDVLFDYVAEDAWLKQHKAG